MRVLKILALIAGLALAAPTLAAEGAKEATLYKNPQCGCCEAYADYLRKNGYTVAIKPTHDLSLIRKQHGVPADFEGCHTMLIDGYVVEGHVPVATLDRKSGV